MRDTAATLMYQIVEPKIEYLTSKKLKEHNHQYLDFLETEREHRRATVNKMEDQLNNVELLDEPQTVDSYLESLKTKVKVSLLIAKKQ